jgi:hypothetical protein
MTSYSKRYEIIICSCYENIIIKNTYFNYFQSASFAEQILVDYQGHKFLRPMVDLDQPTIRAQDRKMVMQRPRVLAALPGEGGDAVVLSAEEKKLPEVAAGWKRHSFNEFVCEKISLHRTIKDGRCQGKKLSDLPLKNH